jgi:Zn-dependent alcohol dehydrogenase
MQFSTNNKIIKGLKKGIILRTPKGEEVLVNFDHVAYCHTTNNNHTSLRFPYAQGKENKGVYLIVVESIEQIQKMLGEDSFVRQKDEAEL